MDTAHLGTWGFKVPSWLGSNTNKCWSYLFVGVFELFWKSLHANVLNIKFYHLIFEWFRRCLEALYLSRTDVFEWFYGNISETFWTAIYNINWVKRVWKLLSKSTLQIFRKLLDWATIKKRDFIKKGRPFLINSMIT